MRLAEHLSGPRPRRRAKEEIWVQVTEILEQFGVERYFKISVDRVFEHEYKQTTPGRPGPTTRCSAARPRAAGG